MTQIDNSCYARFRHDSSWTLAALARRSKLKLPPGGHRRALETPGRPAQENSPSGSASSRLWSPTTNAASSASPRRWPSALPRLEVTTDELLRPNGSKSLRLKPSLRVLRRMEKIQDLPPRRQYFVLKALDALLDSNATKRRHRAKESCGKLREDFFFSCCFFNFQEVNRERPTWGGVSPGAKRRSDGRYRAHGGNCRLDRRLRSHWAVRNGCCSIFRNFSA
jgi:hypothetical protein